jgi:hypothetical protein
MATRHSGGFRRSSPRFRPYQPFHDVWPAILPLAFAAVATILFAAGCASPGEPTARRAPVPEAVADLAASQSGNDVLLTFAIPDVSVGGASLERPPAVQIYRDFEPVLANGESQAAAPSHPTLLTTIPAELVPRYVAQGKFRYLDQLDAADFSSHPNTIVVYSVRTGLSNKKLSAISNLASLRVYPAAEPISDLSGQVTPMAVVLRWTGPQRTPAGPVPAISAYRIYRAEAPNSNSEPSDTSASSNPLPGIPASPPPLQTPLAKIAESSSPGFTDSTVEFGKTYVYSVRSVIQSPGASVESSDSNFLTIAVKDTFPPAAPTGLVGISVPAAGGVAAHVDISWAVSPESDLAGYRVYRSQQAGVLGTPLNSQLLLTPAFRDMNVSSGQLYFYAVTAVDRSGNESAPSAAVSVSVPAVNPAQP